MTEQYIYWSDEELTLMHEHFPAVGVLGCQKLMPYRTHRSIKSKAAALGLRKDFEKSDRARFLAKVWKSEAGCWEWQARLNEDGYGMFSVRTKPVHAHRYSYQLYVAEVPAGLNVCHSCDNPKCVNPDHLFLGTQKENMLDMDRKGRRRNQYSKPRQSVAALFGPANN